MSIISVNIPKIKIICLPQYLLNKCFAFFPHILGALIYKKILNRGWSKDDVINGNMARLTQDHISHLYQKIKLRKIKKKLAPTLAGNEPILRVLHKNIVSFS